MLLVRCWCPGPALQTRGPKLEAEGHAWTMQGRLVQVLMAQAGLGRCDFQFQAASGIEQ